MTFHVFITTPRPGLARAVAPYTVETKEVFATREEAQSFVTAGVLSAGVIALFDAMPSMFPAHTATAGQVFALGQKCAYDGKTWSANFAHTYNGDPSWLPGAAGNLFALVPNPGAGPWVFPAAYPAGSKCIHLGRAYSIIIAHTSQSDWAPNLVPALWQDIGPASSVVPYSLAWWSVVSSADPDYTQINRVKEVA